MAVYPALFSNWPELPFIIYGILLDDLSLFHLCKAFKHQYGFFPRVLPFPLLTLSPLGVELSPRGNIRRYIHTSCYYTAFNSGRPRFGRLNIFAFYSKVYPLTP